MDLSKILSIAGKNGLFKVVSQAKNAVIVESLNDSKRFPAFGHEKISSLEEISVFTTGEDITLKEVFRAFHDKLEGKPAIDHKSDNNSLKKFFLGMVPDYDQDRVYVSDIKKMVYWYNVLVEHKLLDFTGETSEPVKDESSRKKSRNLKKPVKANSSESNITSMEIKKLAGDLEVLQTIRLNKRHFILELQSAEKLPLILPGQFTQVLVKDSPSTFLRRPFSIHSVDYGRNCLRLLIQIKGEGTLHLSRLKEGDSLNLIYPLGNSFSLPDTKDVLLVGGGCGVAPLLFMAQFLNQNHIHPTILLGFRTKEEVSEIGEYSKFGKVLITTDDGTEGEKGLVVDHPLFQRERLDFRKIYCCGPDAMMKAVAKIAGMHRIDCEVSLENTMACGFGVCLCCITPTDKGNERVCVEGPVFNINRLRWH